MDERTFKVFKPEFLREQNLARLERALRLKRKHEFEFNAEGLKLMDFAIVSTYRDCLESGAEEAARILLQNEIPDSLVKNQPKIPQVQTRDENASNQEGTQGTLGTIIIEEEQSQ